MITMILKLQTEANNQKFRATLTEYINCYHGIDSVVVHTPSFVEDKHLKGDVCGSVIYEIMFVVQQQANEQIKAFITTLNNSEFAKLFTVYKATEQRDCSRQLSANNAKYVSYFVEYTGASENDSQWQQHYINCHVPLMQRLPNIKELKVFLPHRPDIAEITSTAKFLLINRVTFDSSIDLQNALDSSVRDEMREDYHGFPPFHGNCFHFAMITEKLL